ncbi:MAG TPA: hypothetical protein VGO49_03050 [Bradyrhizobium sp.]|jgi:hypothetical protein|nr:hypothetical protein [Bradyrhizobium sp.]
MTFTITKEGVLFALAIYAAILSTWNWISAIRKDRRAVRVTTDNKIPIYEGEFGPAWAHIEATNIGQRPVTVTMLAFELEGGGRLFNMYKTSPPGMKDTVLPITLADGQTARLHQPHADIAQALISKGLTGKCKLTPICEDSAGGIHRGEAWDVDPKELMRR